MQPIMEKLAKLAEDYQAVKADIDRIEHERAILRPPVTPEFFRDDKQIEAHYEAIKAYNAQYAEIEAARDRGYERWVEIQRAIMELIPIENVWYYTPAGYLKVYHLSSPARLLWRDELGKEDY